MSHPADAPEGMSAAHGFAFALSFVLLADSRSPDRELGGGFADTQRADLHRRALQEADVLDELATRFEGAAGARHHLEWTAPPHFDGAYSQHIHQRARLHFLRALCYARLDDAARSAEHLDTARRLPPPTRRDAHALLRAIYGARLLAEFAGFVVLCVYAHVRLVVPLPFGMAVHLLACAQVSAAPGLTWPGAICLPCPALAFPA
jgi:hypothetical protein